MIYLAILVGLVLILILVAPQSYTIQRSIDIEKPLEDVFYYLKHLKNQNYWSPWNKKDPNMIHEYEGTDGTVGFISRWEGNKDVGKGEQEIMAINENKELLTQLRFLKPWKSQSEGFLTVEKTDQNTTRVNWGFRGKYNRPLNVMMLFFNMEKSVGKDFNEGLQKLKTVLEQKSE